MSNKFAPLILGERLERYGLSSASAEEIAAFAKQKQAEINARLLQEGVYLMDPASTYIGPSVKIGKGTIIEANTYIYGNSQIGEHNHIGPSSYLDNVQIGSGNQIRFSHLEDTKIGNENEIGPYFRSRGNSVIGDYARVGNFVEFKHVDFASTSKAAHLSYLGDATIEEGVNIGAGTITANYDGKKKHPTHIGKGAFIGSNSVLIAPIEIGDDALVAAGSTLTEDVPEKGLGIARSRQTNKEHYKK